MYGLALFFRYRDHRSEQFLLVVIEDLARFHDGAARETVFTVIEPRAHYHHVLLAGIGTRQNMAQVIKISGIAHRYQNVSGTHAHGPAAQFLIAVHAELIQLLRFAVPLLSDAVFGVCEDREEDYAESHARDRGFILSKQIHNRGHKQHSRNDHQAKWDFYFADVKITRYLPGAVLRLGEAQNQHRKGVHGKTPDHPKGIQTSQLVHISAADQHSKYLQTDN